MFKKLKISFFFRFVSRLFSLSISESRFRRSGLPNRGFRIEGFAEIDFSWKPFVMSFGIDFCCFLEAKEALSGSLGLENRLENERIVMRQILSSGTGGGDQRPI